MELENIFFSSIVLSLFGKNAEGIIFERSSGENIDDSYQTYLQEVFSNEAKKVLILRWRLHYL